MKLKTIPNTSLAATIALLQEPCPGLTAETLVAALRQYEPEKQQAAQKERIEVMLTPKQAASRLSVGRGKIFQLLKQGRLKRILLGKRTARISETELLKLMESGVAI